MNTLYLLYQKYLLWTFQGFHQKLVKKIVISKNNFVIYKYVILILIYINEKERFLCILICESYSIDHMKEYASDQSRILVADLS